MTLDSALLLVAAVGSGLMAGLYFVFSIAVMRALGRISAGSGIAAMQAINAVIVNPWFLAVFFGTAAACLAVAVDAVIDWQATGSVLVLLGSGAYLVGNIVVTIVRNVPMNDALAAVDADSVEGQQVWARYRARWTAWNHVRTGACLFAAVCLTWVLAQSVTHAP